MERGSNEVKRRKVLQSVTVGVASTGLMTANVSGAQSSYGVTVSTSDGIFDNYGDTALNRAKEYLDGAFGEIGPQGDTAKLSKGVPAPVERHGKSFHVENDPCSGYPADYTGILPWWKNYADCNLSGTKDDSNILCLLNHSGGVASQSGKYSIASGGQNITGYPTSYTKYTLDSQYPQVLNTMLEEIGHNLQKLGNYEVEQTGDADYVEGSYYVSPLGEGATGSYNECNDYVGSSPDGHKNAWDESCTVNNYWY